MLVGFDLVNGESILSELSLIRIFIGERVVVLLGWRSNLLYWEFFLVWSGLYDGFIFFKIESMKENIVSNLNFVNSYSGVIRYWIL